MKNLIPSIVCALLASVSYAAWLGTAAAPVISAALAAGGSR